MSINWATYDLGARLVDVSSEANSCYASNVLDPNISTFWLSNEQFPQWLFISLANISIKKDIVIRTFGWSCWQSYTTNPKKVTLHVSSDGSKFKLWDTVSSTSLNKGDQLFCCAPISSAIYPYIALEVTESFGGSQTYMNRIYLYSDEIAPSPIMQIDNENVKNTPYSKYFSNLALGESVEKNIIDPDMNKLNFQNLEISDSEIIIKNTKNLNNKIFNKFSSLSDQLESISSRTAGGIDPFSNELESVESEDSLNQSLTEELKHYEDVNSSISNLLQKDQGGGGPLNMSQRKTIFTTTEALFKNFQKDDNKNIKMCKDIDTRFKYLESKIAKLLHDFKNFDDKIKLENVPDKFNVNKSSDNTIESNKKLHSSSSSSSSSPSHSSIDQTKKSSLQIKNRHKPNKYSQTEKSVALEKSIENIQLIIEKVLKNSKNFSNENLRTVPRLLSIFHKYPNS